MDVYAVHEEELKTVQHGEVKGQFVGHYDHFIRSRGNLTKKKDNIINQMHVYRHKQTTCNFSLNYGCDCKYIQWISSIPDTLGTA